MDDDLRGAFNAILRRTQPRRVVIGFSGGLDSSVLLDLAVRARGEHGLPVIAIHVNHGLSDNAQQWAVHCQRICNRYSVAIQSVAIMLEAKPGISVEAAAREARYEAFDSRIEPGDVLCLAQHADDQAETVLLQLLRGAGVKGLSAMPEIAPFGHGTIVRPLLRTCRERLARYARQRRLSWVEDASNRDCRFDRNFLRAEVMPLLKGRWKGALATLDRSAQLCAEADAICESVAAADWRDCWDKDVDALDVAKIKAIPALRQRNLLRYWIAARRLLLPSRRVLERVLDELIPADRDRQPVVTWRDGEFRRHRQRIYLLKPAETAKPGDYRLHWADGDSLPLPHSLGGLRIHVGLGGICRRLWCAGRVEVRGRSGGERCKRAGDHHHRSLKQLFQEAGVPSWERWRIPLIYIDGELAAVGDDWICQAFAERNDREGIHIGWVKE